MEEIKEFSVTWFRARRWGRGGLVLVLVWVGFSLFVFYFHFRRHFVPLLRSRPSVDYINKSFGCVLLFVFCLSEPAELTVTFDWTRRRDDSGGGFKASSWL